TGSSSPNKGRRGSFSSILRRSSISMERRRSKDLTVNDDERLSKFLTHIALRHNIETSNEDTNSCASDVASNIDIADYDPNDWFLEEDE
ncbi:hypothetical protein SAMD00019534_060800, partial [Acytostelium subglobosum LB1]|uniref:hypothetical protein n=1 Tax=Acytostelium subglobosum LB1 TaxID=1410327 RepID=UPI0006447BC4